MLLRLSLRCRRLFGRRRRLSGHIHTWHAAHLVFICGALLRRCFLASGRCLSTMYPRHLHAGHAHSRHVVHVMLLSGLLLSRCLSLFPRCRLGFRLWFTHARHVGHIVLGQDRYAGEKQEGRKQECPHVDAQPTVEWINALHNSPFKSPPCREIFRRKDGFRRKQPDLIYW